MENSPVGTLYGLQIIIGIVFCAIEVNRRGHDIKKVFLWCIFAFFLPVIAIMTMPKKKE